jgi:DNA-binding Xre family transcriptional regulator
LLHRLTDSVHLAALDALSATGDKVQDPDNEQENEGGVVRVKIREIAERKGISNPFQLMKASGLNYAQCYLYWNGEPKQLGVDAINRLCLALEITPGQLFEFERDPDWKVTPKSRGRIKSSKPNSGRKKKRG